MELIETLVFLYDWSPGGVGEILQESMEKGPALLLLVLAQTGTISRFAAHLARLLLYSQTQYMPGFAALWAANSVFVPGLLCQLYEEQHSLLGRLVDLLDDLAHFDAVMKLCPDLLKLLLLITAFFRRGHDFQVSLRREYDRNPGILRLCFDLLKFYGE
jgi:hypothetical protein